MHILAIGGYSASETTHLTDAFNPVFLDAPGGLDDLDATVRSNIQAIAFKGHHPFGAAEMALLPNIGMIANYGVGYDAIDVAEASRRGILVSNTPDVLNDDVADLAVAMLIMQCREMEQAGTWVRSGKWASDGEYKLTRKMSGARAGILGLGRIGREIADRLSAFKMDIHYWSRGRKDTPGWTHHTDPVSLAAEVDFLVVALVGGPETRGFVTREVIEALGPQGVIVNISRGSTVDEAALLDALESGALGGAALDVFQSEPRINARFCALDNVVLQPHVGSGTVETRAAMARLQRDNLRAFLDGRPLLTPVA